MMEIKFITEDNYTFAISESEVFDNHVCEELMWAEIDENFTVRWEDDFSNAKSFSNLEDAKAHIRANYDIHTPHINGAKWKA